MSSRSATEISGTAGLLSRVAIVPSQFLTGSIEFRYTHRYTRSLRKRATSFVQLHRRHRPRHYQHPLHRLRSLRPHRLRRPEGARADLSSAGMGGAGRQRNLAPHPRGDRRGARISALSPPVILPPSVSPTQRETTVVWDRHRGPCLQRARLAGHCTAGAVAELAADGGGDRFRAQTGLPLATYFSALKIRWILDNVPGVRAAPKPATSSSATSIPSSSGISPAACTSPTAPTPAAPTS